MSADGSSTAPAKRAELPKQREGDTIRRLPTKLWRLCWKTVAGPIEEQKLDLEAERLRVFPSSGAAPDEMLR